MAILKSERASVPNGSFAVTKSDTSRTDNRDQLWVIRWALVLTAIFMISVIPTNSFAQGFGPRAFQLVPDQSNVLALYGFSLEGNRAVDPSVVIQGADIDINLAVLQYTRAFDIKGKQAGVFAIVSGGKIDGALDLLGTTLSDANSGFGDIQLGASFGLIGSPALPMKEYIKYKPGFALGILTLFTLPTGQYDESHALNLGTNRWAAQLGTIMLWYQGDSMLDPKLRTFELVPSITLYGDNSDPFGADNTGQAPIFKLEAHVTQNINKAMFVSLDALYTYGGETSTDGIDNSDRQSALMLGASFNTMVSRSTAIKLSYGRVVSRNDDGPDGSMIRAIVSVLF